MMILKRGIGITSQEPAIVVPHTVTDKTNVQISNVKAEISHLETMYFQQ